MQERRINAISDYAWGAATPNASEASSSKGAGRMLGLQGGTSLGVQELLRKLAWQWQAQGLRIAGVVEEQAEGTRKGAGGVVLRSLVSGAEYALYQDLGPLSTACCLDPGGVSEACQAALDDIARSDVVVLSKFGKLEADGGGLLDAFIVAAEHNRPVLTSVSSLFGERYLEFVGPWGALAPPEEGLLHTWFRHVMRAASCA